MATNETIKRRAVLDAVSHAAEKFEDDIVRLGKRCLSVFGAKGKTQMSNLERAGLTSRRFGNVVGFVKRQTGKDDKGQNWSKKQGGQPRLGEELVGLLERIKQAADSLCIEPPLNEARNEVRLRLASACLRNLHSAYLFDLTLSEKG
jgi:hypothetical protein